jgi:hypothetical protein
VIQDITERKNDETFLRQRMAELACLHQVSAACIEANDEDELLDRATQIIGAHLFSQNFGVLLVDPSGAALQTHRSYRIAGQEGGMVIPLGRGVTGLTAQDGRTRRMASARSCAPRCGWAAASSGWSTPRAPARRPSARPTSA